MKLPKISNHEIWFVLKGFHTARQPNYLESRHKRNVNKK